MSEQGDKWLKYYEKVGLRPRPILLEVLAMIAEDKEADLVKTAYDLGCGAGGDTAHLLADAWHVWAVDSHQNAMKAVLENKEAYEEGQLSFQHASFEEMKWEGKANLINASYSLPFCKPDKFPKVWENILSHMSERAWFAGHFFGPNDDWADNLTTLSKVELEEMFADFEILKMLEEEADRPTALGSMKHWHIFKVIARKK